MMEQKLLFVQTVEKFMLQKQTKQRHINRNRKKIINGKSVI